MKANRSLPDAAVIPVLAYADVREAVSWLARAFGFAERLRIGQHHRSQLQAGEGAVIVAEATGGSGRPAPTASGSVMVRVEDARAHCEQARVAGARILMEPTDFPFGKRQYDAEDPFGHQWTFTETLVDVAPEDWGGQRLRP